MESKDDVMTRRPREGSSPREEHSTHLVSSCARRRIARLGHFTDRNVHARRVRSTEEDSGRARRARPARASAHGFTPSLTKKVEPLGPAIGETSEPTDIVPR